MHEAIIKRHPIPRNWLKVNGMVRVVKDSAGEDVLEVKPVPCSVRKRSKRRRVDGNPSAGV